MKKVSFASSATTFVAAAFAVACQGSPATTATPAPAPAQTAASAPATGATTATSATTRPRGGRGTGGAGGGAAAGDSAARRRTPGDSAGGRGAVPARAAAPAIVISKEAILDSTHVAEEQKQNLEVRARAELVEAVFFNVKGAELRAPERSMLDHKVALLKANPSIRLRIDGNADEKEGASDKDKVALGTERATAVQHYLTEHGVEASRIEVTSSGASQPSCTDHVEWCWSQNRRVVVTIVAGGDKIMPAPVAAKAPLK